MSFLSRSARMLDAIPSSDCACSSRKWRRSPNMMSVLDTVGAAIDFMGGQFTMAYTTLAATASRWRD